MASVRLVGAAYASLVERIRGDDSVTLLGELPADEDGLLTIRKRLDVSRRSGNCEQAPGNDDI